MTREGQGRGYPAKLEPPSKDYGAGRNCAWCGSLVSRYTPTHRLSGLDFCNDHVKILPGAELWSLGTGGGNKQNSPTQQAARASSLSALKLLEAGQDATHSLDACEYALERIANGGGSSYEAAQNYLKCLKPCKNPLRTPSCLSGFAARTTTWPSLDPAWLSKRLWRYMERPLRGSD